MRRRWITGLVGTASLGTLMVGLGGATVAASAAGPLTGNLYSWGTFSLKATVSETPQIVTGVPGTIVQISGSDRDMYALTSTGAVWAWGGEAQGALGNGTSGSGYQTTPVQVQFPAGVSIASLPSPMPQKTGMAIDTNGNAWGWGAAGSGDLCSTAVNKKVPQMITAPQLKGVVTLASGQNNHAIYYTSTGQLYACGDNNAGQLGNGTFTSSISPVQVIGLPAEKVTSVQTSWEDSGALMADGTYWDWGYNKAGELGDGSISVSDVPVQVSLPAAVDAVSQGGSLSNNGQTVAILSNSSVYAWGDDADGQLGIGSSGHHDALPVAVRVPAGTTFVSVNSGGASEYAIDSTGNVWAWGQNNEGQLGIGSTANQSSPVSVGINASQVFSIAYDVAAFSL
jgi:alpha-tubulin suppressor-like RCC1 family protein